MEQGAIKSARFSLSGPRLAKMARKPANRPRMRKARRLPSLGEFVPMPTFRNRRSPPRPLPAGTGIAASGVREQEWLRSHWREYAGRWVALDGNRLVSEAAGAREALEKARAAGVRSPFLVHVTAPSELPFGGW
jgi:Family of unknown function (DUF5678)